MDNNVSTNNFTHVLWGDGSRNAQPLQTEHGIESYLPSNIGSTTTFGLWRSSDLRLEDRTFSHPQAATTSTFGDNNTPPPLYSEREDINVYSEREDINVADADSDDSSDDESTPTVKKRFLNHLETKDLLKRQKVRIEGWLPTSVIGSKYSPKLVGCKDGDLRVEIIIKGLKENSDENAISCFINHIRKYGEGDPLASRLQTIYECMSKSEPIPCEDDSILKKLAIKASFLNYPETMELLKEVDAGIVSCMPKNVISEYNKFFKVDPSKRAELFREYLLASYNVDAISIFIGRIQHTSGEKDTIASRLKTIYDCISNDEMVPIDEDRLKKLLNSKKLFLNHPQTMRLLKDNQECIEGYLSDDTMGSIFREQLVNNSQPDDTTTIILNTLENSPEEDAISDFIGKIREMKKGKRLARQLQSLYEGIGNNEEIPAPGAGYEQAIRNKNSFICDLEVKESLYFMVKRYKELLDDAIHALPCSIASSGDKYLWSNELTDYGQLRCLIVILNTSFRGDATDQLIRQLAARIKTTKDEELKEYFKVLQTRHSKISATDDSSNIFSEVRSHDQAVSSLSGESIRVLNRSKHKFLECPKVLDLLGVIERSVYALLPDEIISEEALDELDALCVIYISNERVGYFIARELKANGNPQIINDFLEALGKTPIEGFELHKQRLKKVYDQILYSDDASVSLPSYLESAADVQSLALKTAYLAEDRVKVLLGTCPALGLMLPGDIIDTKTKNSILNGTLSDEAVASKIMDGLIQSHNPKAIDGLLDVLRYSDSFLSNDAEELNSLYKKLRNQTTVSVSSVSDSSVPPLYDPREPLARDPLERPRPPAYDHSKTACPCTLL